MKKNLLTLILAAITLMGFSSCRTNESKFTVEHLNDGTALIHITNPTNYIILPIQNESNEAHVLVDNNLPSDTYMDIRLATDSVQYYVPMALPTNVKEVTLKVRNLNSDAIAWQKMELSDTFDASNTDPFRPVYHHTPLYGWMNDANGLVYKDGEYHLYYQYNPYGTKWGNMHWGHSVSKDLVNWEHLDPAIDRDPMGHIFSGSSVVDTNNDAGFGKDAIVAFYTSASDENGQIQCLAYSNDNGRTFTKYENNPILVPVDGLKDFRDPKVFWYAPDQKWVMIVSADKEMRFYSSNNLKDWTYMSAFGEGYGAKPSQFECPDMVELAVDGNPDNKKWVLIVNINPGSPFGGSATQYFTGDFDGTKFTTDMGTDDVKWLDWGKDHYATVCFSNTGDRVIGVPWMNNWQYANYVPVQQFRSANALPRELYLYTEGNEVFMGADVVAEAQAMRKEYTKTESFDVKDSYTIESLFAKNDGAYELIMNIEPGKAKVAGIELLNSLGEHVNIYFDMQTMKLVMDRSESGIVEFGELSEPHFIENHDNRKTTSINYVNDFALATWAPVNKAESYQLHIFVDVCSIEIFLNNGKVAMTNLVFPNEPYNILRFYSEGGEMKVNDFTAYKLGL